MTGRVKGLDAENNVFEWTSDDGMSWSNCNVSLFNDHPSLRSAGDKQWAIPTILLCTQHFGFYSKAPETISLKRLYSVYKGTCQFCLQHIPYHQATKDHLYPKSKGGTDHTFNLVLACRKCNNTKDSIFPFFDVEGKEVKPRKIMHSGVFVPDTEEVREEWKPFLYMT